MAVDMFLNIEGIPGESQDKTHAKEIDILAWSWGASNSGTTHVGGGSGAGKVNVQDMSLTKYVDAASVKLFEHVCNGAHIATATLVVRKAGGTPLEYMIIKMDDILVVSQSMGGSGGEDRLTENISLNFGSFEYQYVEQDKAGKPTGDKPMVKWDIAANAPK
jgi:type VI secretion system secreted protein Hcp